MLFSQDVLRGIAEGRVTLAFRRWRKAPPAEGSLLRTAVGVLRLEHVRVVDEEDITPEDVARTGMSVAELRQSLTGAGTLFRVELARVGDDPRLALRATPPSDDEMAAIIARLKRLDGRAPWTGTCLQLIAEHPGVPARRLAESAGLELQIFKRRIRQLKELGLTESLEIGYRLAPRGEDVLRRIGSR